MGCLSMRFAIAVPNRSEPLRSRFVRQTRAVDVQCARWTGIPRQFAPSAVRRSVICFDTTTWSRFAKLALGDHHGGAYQSDGNGANWCLR